MSAYRTKAEVMDADGDRPGADAHRARDPRGEQGRRRPRARRHRDARRARSRSGSPSASREIEGTEVPVGTLDISFYRDDVAHRAAARGAPHRHPVRPSTARRVVLVDDVLFTGPHDPRRDGRDHGLRPARAASSSPCSSTAATASCPSAPTSSARTCRPRGRERVKVLLDRDRRPRRRRDPRARPGRGREP